MAFGPGEPSGLTIPSESRFQTVCPCGGTYVPKTLSNVRFSPMISITCLIGVFVWSSLDEFDGRAQASGAASCVSNIAPAPIAAVNFLRLLVFILFLLRGTNGTIPSGERRTCGVPRTARLKTGTAQRCATATAKTAIAVSAEPIASQSQPQADMVRVASKLPQFIRRKWNTSGRLRADYEEPRSALNQFCKSFAHRRRLDCGKSDCARL